MEMMRQMRIHTDTRAKVNRMKKKKYAGSTQSKE